MVQENLFQRLVQVVRSEEFSPKEFTSLLSRCTLQRINLNGKDEHNRNLLFHAIGSDKEAVYLTRLIHAGVEWTCVDYKGRTLLHWAAKFGHLEGFRLFMHRGLDVHALDWDGKAPLDYCLLYGSLEYEEDEG